MRPLLAVILVLAAVLSTSSPASAGNVSLLFVDNWQYPGYFPECAAEGLNRYPTQHHVIAVTDAKVSYGGHCNDTLDRPSGWLYVNVSAHNGSGQACQGGNAWNYVGKLWEAYVDIYCYGVSFTESAHYYYFGAISQWAVSYCQDGNGWHACTPRVYP